MKQATVIISFTMLLLITSTTTQGQRIKIPKSALNTAKPGYILGRTQNTVHISPPRRISATPQMSSVINFAARKNGAALPGLKGNGIFRNDGRNGSAFLNELNFSGKPNVFKKYDILPPTPGSRGTERLVINERTGTVFYTSEHYKTFREVRHR